MRASLSRLRAVIFVSAFAAAIAALVAACWHFHILSAQPLAIQSHPRWGHVETGTLLLSMTDDLRLHSIQVRLGQSTVLNYPNGGQVGYVDKDANAALLFADAGAAGSELIVCRPDRLPGPAREVELDDIAFVSSRRIALGDSPQCVRAVLGKPHEVLQKPGVLTLIYHAYAEDGAPCGACYDGRYLFRDDRLVEMRFWDGS